MIPFKRMTETSGRRARSGSVGRRTVCEQTCSTRAGTQAVLREMLYVTIAARLAWLTSWLQVTYALVRLRLPSVWPPLRGSRPRVGNSGVPGVCEHGIGTADVAVRRQLGGDTTVVADERQARQPQSGAREGRRGTRIRKEARALRTRPGITAPFWTPMHPAGLRCSSLTYARYARSSRLAGRAPRRPEWHTYSWTGPNGRRIELPAVRAQPARRE
jgi:hypothetical protein